MEVFVPGKYRKAIAYIPLVFSLSSSLLGIENTKVIPKGARSLDFKSARTIVSQKTNRVGSLQPLAKPLAQNLTFREVLKGESGVNKLQLLSFLEGKFDLDDSLGSFTPEIKGSAVINAFVFTYGITDNFNLAVAVPFYEMDMRVEMGFQHSEKAEKLINYLNDPKDVQKAKAREVAKKLNHSVDELNAKLRLNNYAPIENWKKSGIGDTMLAGKYRMIMNERLRFADTFAVFAPTGYRGDPNNNLSQSFGAGTWGLANTFYADEFITSELWLNQYFKYRYQAPGRKSMRLKRADEAIAVSEENVSYKTGDTIEAGASIQYEPWYGLILGTGVAHSNKAADTYHIGEVESRRFLEKDTDEHSMYWETKLGFQSIPAFHRKEFPVPFILSLEYKKHLMSKNTVVKDLYLLDLNLFF